MAIARSWTVAIALVILGACADGRGLPSHLPAAPKSASDIFTKLGLEGLSLDMFPGDEGETVTRTFTDAPGKTQTVSVTRSPGGAVSVKASTEFSSSLDGLPSEFGSSGFRPSELDFPSLQSVIDAASRKAGPSAKAGSVFKTPAPAKASVPAKVTKAPAKKAKSAPKKKAGKKGGKKSGKKSTTSTTIVTDQQSAAVVAPVVPLEKEEAIPDLFTINGAAKERVVTGTPVLPKVGIPTAAPSAPAVTPTRNAGERVRSGPGRVTVEENTRASTRDGPLADLRATRVEKDGVTATVVSGSSVAPAPFTVAPAPVSARKETVEACSDTETTAEAVERCVNAVRQNPAKYAALVPCTIPSYAPRAPLSTSSHLSAAAVAHAYDMAATQTVTHAGSDGSTMGKRIWERAGFVGSPIAENVAGGQRSAKDVVFAWMCSSGHRKNIMSCEHDSMGTGLTRNGRVYWAQTFGCTKYNKCEC